MRVRRFQGRDSDRSQHSTAAPGVRVPLPECVASRETDCDALDVMLHYRRTLECMRLKDGDYQIDTAGHDLAEVPIAMFPGLTIQLSKIWI